MVTGLVIDSCRHSVQLLQLYCALVNVDLDESTEIVKK